MVVVDVTKVLASVRRMCECGNKVVFDSEGSYVLNKQTGSKTPIELRRGAYVIDMWVKKGGRERGEAMDIDECGNSDTSEDVTRLGAEVTCASGP